MGNVQLNVNQLIRGLRTPSPLTTNLAMQSPVIGSSAIDNLLLHSAAIPSLHQSITPSNNEGPSLFSKVLSYLSIPGYTVDNMINDAITNAATANSPGELLGSTLKTTAQDVVGGVSALANTKLNPLDWIPAADKVFEKGQAAYNQPTTGVDILKNLGVHNNVALGLGGFGLTVATDPLSYVGGFGLGKGVVEKGVEHPELFGAAVKSADAASEAAPGLSIPQAVKTPVGLEDSLSRSAVLNKVSEPPPLSLPALKSPEELQALSDAKPALTPEEIVAAPKQQIFKDTKGRFVSPESIKGVSELEKIKAEDLPLFKGMDLTPKDVKAFTEQLPAIRKVMEAEKAPVAAASGALADHAAEAVKDVLKGAKADLTELNQVKQVNLFRTILKTPGIGGVKNALSVLRSAEDTLIARGISPVAFSGERMRLSDVLNRLGFAEKGADKNAILHNLTVHPTNADLVTRAAVHAELAKRTNIVNDIMTKFTDLAKNADVENIPTIAERVATAQHLRDVGADFVKHAGGSEFEQTRIKNLIKETAGLYIASKPERTIENFADNFGKELWNATVQGKVSVDAALALNRSVERVMGAKYNNLIKFALNQANEYPGMKKAIEGFFIRTATWYGRADIFRYYKDAFDFQQENAHGLAKLLNGMARHFSQDDNVEAFRSAQNPEYKIEDRLMPLAAIYRDYFNHTLSLATGHKITSPADYASAVAKANLKMDEVNAHLKMLHVEDFEFTDKPWIDLVGKTRDFSANGEGWLNSWEARDIKDPLRFMYNVNLAVGRAMAEQAYYGELAAHWGSRIKTSTHFIKAAPRHLEGYYFQPEINEQIKSLDKLLHRDIWRPNSPMMKFYAKMLGSWKRGVTIYLPSHHIRNLIGDSWLMWAAGHNNPKYFTISAKILKSQRSELKDTFEQFAKMAGEDVNTWREGLDDSAVIFRNGSHSITARQLFASAWQHGLLKNARTIEDTLGTAPIRGLLAPFHGHVHDFASGVSEVREWFVRMAHYSSAVDKKLKAGRTDLKQMFDEAAHEVREWHPDGSDMTDAEKSFRLAVPFYSWTRKVVPLLVKTAVQRPAKLLMYPRAELALQQASGIQGGTMIDPFPNDQLFPNWIRAYGIGPIGQQDRATGPDSFWASLGKHVVDSEGNPLGYTVVNPGDPFEQTFTGLTGFGNPLAVTKALMENTTPAFQIPAELGFGQSTLGTPINSDPSGFWQQNVPALAPFARVFNGIPGLGTTRDYTKTGSHFDIEALINLLTGAGMRDTGPYIKQAQIESGLRAKGKGP